jgi:hypothetical protein
MLLLTWGALLDGFAQPWVARFTRGHAVQGFRGELRGVSCAWVDRVKRRRREHGEIAPRKQTTLRSAGLVAQHTTRSEKRARAD